MSAPSNFPLRTICHSRDGAAVTLVVTLAALPIVTLATVRPEGRTAFEGDKVEEVGDPPDSSSHGDTRRQSGDGRAV
jgi:hypothetical protein